MPKPTLAAIDLGATSGRVIVGQVGDRGLELTEAYRFPNYFTALPPYQYWDPGRLLAEIRKGLAEAKTLFPELRTCGVDTWGVDHAILNREGRLAFPVHAYRDERTNELMRSIREKGEERRLFDLTGLPLVNFNTGLQLMESLRAFPSLRETGERVMLFPEYFGYLLTGKAQAEFSHASTTQLLDIHGRGFAEEALDYFGIPRDWFSAPAEAGRILGPVTAGNDLNGIDLALVPGHDTSCAFEAIPRDGDSLLVSSGTWMLVGSVTRQPLLGDEAFALGVSNERTGTGGYRPNKTILGLWLLEQIIPSFDKRPQSDAEWNALIAAAEELPVPEGLLDTNDAALFNPEDMKAAIDNQLKGNGHRPPEDLPGYVALICASLGASLRDIARRFESILGKDFGNIVIVGGGSKNRLLCQRIADFSRKKVTSYQLEASSVGNMAYQLLARGDLPSLEAFHDLIRPSLSTREYPPQ